MLVFYAIALPVMVGLTHFFRVRNIEKPIGTEST
jgi:hypothetical protein